MRRHSFEIGKFAGNLVFGASYFRTWRFPREMLGGKQQRVALVRTLASDPLMVLLDEPLSAVDVETRSKLPYEIENAQSQPIFHLFMSSYLYHSQ